MTGGAGGGGRQTETERDRDRGRRRRGRDGKLEVGGILRTAISAAAAAAAGTLLFSFCWLVTKSPDHQQLCRGQCLPVQSFHLFPRLHHSPSPLP